MFNSPFNQYLLRYSRWGPQRSQVEIGDIVMSNYPSFNELLKLAQENPEALEKFRLEQVELIISQAPIKYQRRLRGLQFQIDVQRALHANSPMGACLKMSQMMHDSFDELRACLNKITNSDNPLRHDLENYEDNHQSDAKILRFPATSM